ncbi:MAG TPA: response regulator [Dehalococcoidia bacterium]|nr:response regulator [Dehalococcoidia bacterium]
MGQDNGQINILIVDDLHSMRMTLGGILEDEGYSVMTAEDGYHAIEAVGQRHFNIIFIDIKMPGIDGVQTFREIKKIDPDAAVVMMTAYSVEELFREAMEEGAYAIIYKPFDINMVIAIIEELLTRKTLVLVVDDHFADRETLKTVLEEKGYRVATASDGTEAIDMVRSRHYDIIFLDVRLPDMTGFETFEQVKKIDPQATVIMMTGYAEEDLIKNAIEAGAYTCLRKPFDIDKVITLVNTVSRER